MVVTTKKTGGPRVRCLRCGDIIQSLHVHDFRPCYCGAIFIDGGAEYTRCGGNIEDFEWFEDPAAPEEKGTQNARR